MVALFFLHRGPTMHINSVYEHGSLETYTPRNDYVIMCRSRVERAPLKLQDSDNQHARAAFSFQRRN